MITIVHVGNIQTSGWMIIKKIQVAIVHDDKMMRNNLIFSLSPGVVVLISSSFLFGCKIMNLVCYCYCF